MKTNIGEFIAGAYYQICRNAWPVIYNQPIYFKEPKSQSVWIDGQEYPVGWSHAELKALTGGELKLSKREVDVVALNAGTKNEIMDCTCEIENEHHVITLNSGSLVIAECSETNSLSRPYEEMRGKIMADVILAGYRQCDMNLTIEIWAPTISREIAERIPELANEMRQLFMKLEENATLQITPVSGEEYYRRICCLKKHAATDTSCKFDNPFYRSLQMLARAEKYAVDVVKT